MPDINSKIEKDDYADAGLMLEYDEDSKPICMSCMSLVWVVAAGRDHKWNWKCTNCQAEWSVLVPFKQEKK